MKANTDLGTIVLDSDGVLLDYHTGYDRAWERAFGTHQALSEVQYRAVVAATKADKPGAAACMELQRELTTTALHASTDFVADCTGFGQQPSVALAFSSPAQRLWMNHGHGLTPAGNSWSVPQVRG